ncbi:MFS transporter, partial [Lactobacillus selangorensis]
ISWVFSGYSIASVFGVPIGTWISDQVGWRVAFWLIVVISVIIAIMFTLSLPSDLTQGATTGLLDQLQL